MISIDPFSALLQYAVDTGVQLAPLFDEQFQHFFAKSGNPVEPFPAIVFMAPLALEQTLLFQAPDQRIQGALINFQAPSICFRNE
jgi:hypothetical protein